MSDHATIAAATAAGYRLTEHDRGANLSPRYKATLAKMITGGSHQTGFEFRADGFSDASAAAARTAVLASLNGARNQRYGTGATAGKDPQGNAFGGFDSK